jgi:hypothetical protein
MPISGAYIKLRARNGAEVVVRKDAIIMLRATIPGETGRCAILLQTGESQYVAESLPDVMTALMEEV